MEKISIGELPPGTTEKLELLAKSKGFTKINGKPNLSLFMRNQIEGMLKCKKK